jgi:hypothetical protein
MVRHLTLDGPFLKNRAAVSSRSTLRLFKDAVKTIALDRRAAPTKAVGVSVPAAPFGGLQVHPDSSVGVYPERTVFGVA